MAGGGGGGREGAGPPGLLARGVPDAPATDPPGEVPLDPVEHLLAHAGPGPSRPAPPPVDPFEVVHWLDGRFVYVLALSIPAVATDATHYLYDWGDGAREEGPAFTQHRYDAEGDRFLLSVTRFTTDGPTHTTVRWLDLSHHPEPTAMELVLTFGEGSHAPFGERPDTPTLQPRPQGNVSTGPRVVYEVPVPPAPLVLVAVVTLAGFWRAARR